MRDDFLDERQRSALRALSATASQGFYLADIAAMKIEAIASRGARKDFYDLYFICAAGLSLTDAVRAFERRFASAHPDLYHRLRALTYFDDAEKEPEPIVVRPAAWADIRSFFEEEVRAIWKQP